MILKLILGVSIIGLIAKLIDNARANKLIREYRHVPGFEKVLDHYNREK